MRAPFLALTLLAAGLPAQQTWIFNSAGGGHFTDLQVAVNSVSPGDTILLQSHAGYQQIYVQQSVRLVGDVPGVSIYMLVVGQMWLPTIEVSLTNVDTTTLEVTNSRVSCELLTSQRVYIDSSVVACHRCTIDGSPLLSGATIVANASRVTFDECTLLGSPGGAWNTMICHTFTPVPALLVRTGSRAQLSHSTLTGAGSAVLCNAFSYGTPALQAEAGTQVQLAACSLAANVAAVAGGGLIEHEGTTFSSPFTGVPTTLPVTTGDGALPGGTLTWGIQGPAGLPAVAVASLGMRSPVVAPEGIVWIDLNAFTALGLGLLDAQGRMAGGFPIPLGFQRGYALTVQAAVQLPTRPTLTAALPTLLHVR